MAAQIVVGLYQSKGIAEDACNRLRTEGVADRDIYLKLLKETGPIPAAMDAELAALSIDPMIWGNVRDTYIDYIRNGETAVLVRAATAADVDLVSGVLGIFEPLVVELLKSRPATQPEAQVAAAARSPAISSGE